MATGLTKAGGPNMVRRLIDINGSAGALVSIKALGPVRGWRVRESVVKGADGSAVVPQGFSIYIPNDATANGFTTKFARPAAVVATQPGEFPEFENFNHASQHGAHGEVFGGPGNPDAASIGATTATELCRVISATATATTLEFVEYY